MRNKFVMEVHIRPGRKRDIPKVFAMIMELVKFQGVADQVTVTVDQLICDGFPDEGSPKFHIFVAENLKAENTRALINPEIVGYTFYNYAYSSMQGPTIWAGDLYVKPEYRKRGIGPRLILHVLKIAYDMGAWVDGQVLSWNKPAQKVYQQMGMVDNTLKEKWHLYWFDVPSIEKALIKGGMIKPKNKL